MISYYQVYKVQSYNPLHAGHHHGRSLINPCTNHTANQRRSAPRYFVSIKTQEFRAYRCWFNNGHIAWLRAQEYSLYHRVEHHTYLNHNTVQPPSKEYAKFDQKIPQALTSTCTLHIKFWTVAVATPSASSFPPCSLEFSL